MDGKIRFLHIPKTAGSTFVDCLTLLYLRSYLLRRQFVFSGDVRADRQRFERLSPGARRRIRLCTGHAPRVTGCAELDALPTITLLRHPVARVQSFCRHVSEGKSPQIHAGGPFDLDAFLDSGRMQLNSFQTRMLLGNDDYRLPAGDAAALAERAFRVLERDFACFGLTEEMDSTLLLFRQVLGWRGWPVYRSRNESDPAGALVFEARHIARIEALNDADIAVYDRARALFHRRLQAQCPGLGEELPRFRAAVARAGHRFAPIDLARGLGRLGRSVAGLRTARQ